MNSEINEIIDVESAKERFLGNYQLFSKFLYQFPDKTLFSDLENAYKSGDAKSAFEYAHTLKGVAGNLSLKLFCSFLFDIVETLRAGNLPDEEEWNKLTSAYNKTIEYILKLKNENDKLF